METFGRYLAQQRELRAMSVAEVAAATRISRQHLEALEEDRVDDLPGDAFALGYVRSVAGCLGLNVEDAVLRFQERQAERPPPKPKARSRRSPLRWRPILLLGLLALGIGWVFFGR